MKDLTIGSQLIAEERQKQIDKHGFTAEHHVSHPEWYEEDQLPNAALSILILDSLCAGVPKNWDVAWFHDLKNRSRKERLIIAGALIVAELDRLAEIEKNK